MFCLQKENFDQKINNIFNSDKQTKKYLHQYIFMIIHFILLNRKIHRDLYTYIHKISKNEDFSH